MKIEHDKFKHMANKESEGKEIPVHNVMPPDEEAAYMKQMSEIANSTPPPEELASKPPIDDVFVEQELKKKAALEKLVMFKQPTLKKVDIGGVEFTFKLLNVKENAAVYKMIKELPQEEQISKTSVVLLAAALVSADGIKIEDTYSGPSGITDPIMQRYYELSNWNMPIINALTKALNEFNNETTGKYNKDFLKK